MIDHNLLDNCKRLLLCFACAFLLYALSGCAQQSPIVRVTPLVSESAEITSDQATQTPDAVPSETASASNTTPQLAPTHAPLPTIPLAERIPRGEALAAAREADVALQIPVSNPIEFDQDPVPLRFSEFFVDFDPRSTEAPKLSDKLLSLDGRRVVIEGYMAPPLQLGLDWFMMTRFRLGFCPFHSSAATITPDIALIYVEGPELQQSDEPLRIEGELHVGEAVDWRTGMVSLVRIYTEAQAVEPIGLK